MQYCSRCRRTCGDDLPRCPNCRSNKLRQPAAGDMVAVYAGDMYTAGQICAALAGAGICCRQESTGEGYFGFECTEMPTDRLLLVDFAVLEEARPIAAGAMRRVEEERGTDAQDGAPAGAKRLVGEALSIVAFLILVMLAVFGADAVANWVKGIF